MNYATVDDLKQAVKAESITGLSLPGWYNDHAHNSILGFIPNQKLQAVKILNDLSKTHETQAQYGLLWAKNVVEAIVLLSKGKAFERDATDDELKIYLHDPVLADEAARVIYGLPMYEPLIKKGHKQPHQIIIPLLKYVPSKVLKEFIESLKP